MFNLDWPMKRVKCYFEGLVFFIFDRKKWEEDCWIKTWMYIHTREWIRMLKNYNEWRYCHKTPQWMTSDWRHLTPKNYFFFQSWRNGSLDENLFQMLRSKLRQTFKLQSWTNRIYTEDLKKFKTHWPNLLNWRKSMMKNKKKKTRNLVFFTRRGTFQTTLVCSD